jgi:SAM-dependent methyltransferase
MTAPGVRAQSWRARTAMSVRKRGLWSTAMLIPGALGAIVRGTPEVDFDRRYGVDTAGVIVPQDLQGDPRYHQSNWYGATSEKLFRQMLAHVKEDFRDFVFVDYGCGKGKPLLLAAQFPFRKIIGIDIWPELLGIARRNVENYSGPRLCTDFEVLEINATNYVPPEDIPGIYYFFDPFQADVMRVVLGKIRESLQRRPRKAYVVYCEPDRPDVLEDSGFVELLAKTSHFRIYKALSR